MWIFLGLVAVGLLLYFLLHTSPDERVLKADAAIGAGQYRAALEQITWLLEHRHPAAAAQLARLHLVKAGAALQGIAAPALAGPELEQLYAVRGQHSWADLELVARVERESGEVLAACTAALAQPAEASRNWAAALAHYEKGLERMRTVPGLAANGGPGLVRLQNGAVACHEQLLRADVQPRLNTAAALLPQGKFDESVQALALAEGCLKGPFVPLRERAAATLRPLVQAQRLAVQQARQVAEATRLLVQARQILDKWASERDLTRALDTLEQAQMALTAAAAAGMPTFTQSPALQMQVRQLRGRALRGRAEAYERQQQWAPASVGFEAARSCFAQLKDATGAATMQVRQGMVVVKSGQGTVLTDAAIIGRAEARVRVDFAYRAAVAYLRVGNVETAAVFLPFLTGQVPEAGALAEAVRRGWLQALRHEIEQANALAQDEYAPFGELKKLYETLPALARRTAAIDAALGRQLSDLRPYVFGRLLTAGLSQGQLLPVLDLLTADPGFHTRPETLKNVGIVCLRLAVEQGLTAANYERVVGFWLTALHANEVLLASLDSTSWDDELTFTLADSLGLRTGTDLPTNVNRRAADATNISLGEAQRELREAFEKALHRIENAALQAQITAFYDSQQTALSTVIAQLNAGGAVAGGLPPVAAPFTAVALQLNQEIIDHFVARHRLEKREELLDCALPYLSTPVNPQLAAYQAALEVERKIAACFEVPRRTKLKPLPALLKSGTPHFKAYPQLQQRLLARLTDAVKLANQEEEDGQLVPCFEALVTAFPAHEPFQVLGAHHLCDWCVASLNTEKMEEAVALTRLAQGWGWVPHDQRLADNLCILFANVWHGATGARQAQAVKQLETVVAQARRQRTPALQHAIAEQLAPAQRDVYQICATNGIDVAALITAARLGLSAHYTPEGLAIGKKLPVLLDMVALAS